jgi:hypothetical protein
MIIILNLHSGTILNCRAAYATEDIYLQNKNENILGVCKMFSFFSFCCYQIDIVHQLTWKTPYTTPQPPTLNINTTTYSERIMLKALQTIFSLLTFFSRIIL